MSCIDQDVLAPIRTRLLSNRLAREKYGRLLQDSECGSGEVFYGNLRHSSFEALPLSTKRRGAPAYVTRLVMEKDGGGRGWRILSRTFEQAYGDRESFGVFVGGRELELLGIEH